MLKKSILTKEKINELNVLEILDPKIKKLLRREFRGWSKPKITISNETFWILY